MPSGLSNQHVMRIVNRYIGVNGGYLGDFSYRTHAEFYPEYCGLDIDPSAMEGTTRERFMTILAAAAPRHQAKILRGVVARFPVDDGGAPGSRTIALRDELLALATACEDASPVPSPSPRVTSEVVERAIADAAALIESTGATSGVDRVHTALHGHLIALCVEAGIAHDEDASITTLLKLLTTHHPRLKPQGPRADDVAKVFRALGTIIDALQPVRNRASVAHPNKELLGAPEAMLVINAGRTILHYLDARGAAG